MFGTYAFKVAEHEGTVHFARSLQLIPVPVNENAVLLRDVEVIRERWVWWFHILLNSKSPRLDPNIAESLDRWPENMPLRVQPTIQELTDAISSLAKRKEVGPNGGSVELFKITLHGDLTLRRRLLDFVVRIWRGGEVPQQWKDAIIKLLHKKKDRIETLVRQLQWHLAGSARQQNTAEDYRSPPQRVL